MHGAGLVGGAGRALATASARTGAREKAQGRLTSLRGFVACRNSFSELGKLFRLLAIFSDRSRRFPINRGRGRGGGFETFFRNFFFSRVLGAGRGEGDPETRGTSCAIPTWNVPKSIFGGGETEKVSPNVIAR